MSIEWETFQHEDRLGCEPIHRKAIADVGWLSALSQPPPRMVMEAGFERNYCVLATGGGVHEPSVIATFGQ